jgi:hypothetical protein
MNSLSEIGNQAAVWTTPPQDHGGRLGENDTAQNTRVE